MQDIFLHNYTFFCFVFLYVRLVAVICEHFVVVVFCAGSCYYFVCGWFWVVLDAVSCNYLVRCLLRLFCVRLVAVIV